MKIIHHFGIKYSHDAERQAFVDMGIDLQLGTRAPSGSFITSFEIAEDDPRWLEARRLAVRFQITESVRTEFDRPEIEAARALGIFASSQRDYPEPSEKRGFLAATFDLSDYCSRCGVGRCQIRPFRLKSAPVLKRSMMQLNWIFDEYLVARNVWTAVFEPLGIDYWPVLLDRTGDEIDSVVQLRISHCADLLLGETNVSVCPECGRAKRRLDLKGFCPGPSNIPAPIFKSTQYFGSDGAAFRRVLISSSLHRMITKARLRGVEFYPCAPDPRQPGR